MSFCPVDKHFRSRIRVGEEELGFLQLLRQLPHGPPRVITDDLLHPLHHLYASSLRRLCCFLFISILYFNL